MLEGRVLLSELALGWEWGCPSASQTGWASEYEWALKLGSAWETRWVSEYE
jgi:hypothetical protein